MKQRLIGAVVLGCLAVIFIPMLLDGEGVTRVDLNVDIPPAPTQPVMPEVEPRRPQLNAEPPAQRQVDAPTAPRLPLSEPGGGAEQAADTQATPTALTDSATQPARDGLVGDAEQEVGNAAPQQARLDASGLPEAWSVRLATFAEIDNAKGLVSRLLRNEYKGYSRPVESSRGRLTAVYVGPVLSRAEANALRAELENQFNLSGIVEQYDIEQLEQ